MNISWRYVLILYIFIFQSHNLYTYWIIYSTLTLNLPSHFSNNINVLGETSADDSPLNSENLDVILQDCIENYCANVNTVVEHSLLNEALSECCENHVLLFWKAVNDRQTDDPGERVI